MSQVFYDIEATEKKHRRQSAIITLIVFAIIIFILFLMGLPRMIPPPSEVGIEIALGNSDYGGGEEQPTTIEEVKTVPLSIVKDVVVEGTSFTLIVNSELAALQDVDNQE